MIIYAFLFLFLKVVSAQRSVLSGSSYDAFPYYNLAPRPGAGVLQDLSNARILSNEPFIISFEFPKIVGKGGSGRSRKSRYGGKRSKTQRKKNRKLRQFRQIILPEGDLVERTKRFQNSRRPPGLEEFGSSSMLFDGIRGGKHLIDYDESVKAIDRSNFGRLLKYEQTDIKPFDSSDSKQSNVLQTLITPKKHEVEDKSDKFTDVNLRWESIKDKWSSLFTKPKAMAENEVDEDERMKAKSRKMWANCQLLKLLKAPQRNPFFYKLLPSDYPALIMKEEKQLQCNQVYDITELARDKKMIAEKIDQLEKLLSSGIGRDPNMRTKRDIHSDSQPEEENTLQDESLQGKSEGEVRSDRSMRTKMHPGEKLQGRKEMTSDRNEENKKLKKRNRLRNRTRHNRKKDSKRENRNHTGKNENEGNSDSAGKQSDGNQGDLSNRERTTKPDGSPGNAEQRKEGVRTGRMINSKQITQNEVPETRALQEISVGPKFEDPEGPGVKREKQQTKSTTDNNEKVLSPGEVNKIIRQKELEANIFDKVLRAMKKYEDGNPYDETFKPQKRESANETAEIASKNDSGEDGLEVEEAVKKLAKIFKVLGVRSEAKKSYTDCGLSEEDRSVESNEDEKSLKKSDRHRTSKSGRCTCAEDCPVCQNCLKCFKECRKNSLALKNPLWNKHSVIGSETADAEHETGATSDKKLNLSSGVGVQKDTNIFMTPPLQPPEETATDRSNSIKLERMYRSKLPPSRDHVRVFFDNPDNKLLVWTKRGRRTMPWGPLTSDLQLYRDRARQILKSAEDILQRIKETEEKIHSSGNYDNETVANKEKDLDEIIKNIVNEDETKSMLRPSWKEGVEESGTNKLHETEGEHSIKEACGADHKNEEKKIMESRESSEDVAVYRTLETNKLEDNDDSSPSRKSTTNVESLERESVSSVKSEGERVEFNNEREAESKSIEAAVELLKQITADQSIQVKEDNQQDDSKQEMQEKVIDKITVNSEEEDIPAKVEAVSKTELDDTVKEEDVQEESSEGDTDASGIFSNIHLQETVERAKARQDGVGKFEETEKGTQESFSQSSFSDSDEVYSSEKSMKGFNTRLQQENVDEEQEETEAPERYSDDSVEIEKEASDEGEVYSYEDPESASGELKSSEVIEASKNAERQEYQMSSEDETKGNEEGENVSGDIELKYNEEPVEKNIFEDQIKPIEENYIIKGVKQTKEEKDAILKALLHMEGTTDEAILDVQGTEEEGNENDKNHGDLPVLQTEVVESQNTEQDSLKTLITHMEKGHMDADDFHAVKMLDDSKIDNLVSEMQKGDKGQQHLVDCETRMKLCQAACRSGNGTDTEDVNKYDLIKGFLTWLKGVQMDEMVPISV